MRCKDNSTTIMVFIAFLLSFIVLWNASDLVIKVENQKQGLNAYKNVKNVNINFENASDMIENGEDEKAKKYSKNKIESILNYIIGLKECNISFTSMYFTIKHRESNINAEIILKKNEDLPYIIEKFYDEEGGVLVGESLAKYINVDNESINLSNESYVVKGILKNYGMSKQDERVIILYDRLTKEQKNSLKSQMIDEYCRYGYSTGITLRVESKRADSMEKMYISLSNYLNNVEDAEFRTIPTREQLGEQNYWYQLYHSIFGSVSILFAIINGIVVSNLWYQRRRREFLIRRIFGYNGIGIWFLIWKEMGKIAISSLVCSTLIWIIYAALKGNEVLWNLIGIQCLVMVFGIILVIFTTTIIPYKKTMSIEPVKGLCGYPIK